MDSIVFDENSARQLVETKLQANDVNGAINFARRMQNSFPKLNMLFRFLGNIVVQVSGEDEEIDWYTVMGVDPSADSKTMKQHYVNLAKNSRLGSDEAHKILNKAWDTLSNKYTRNEFDLRRRLRAMQQNSFVVKEAMSTDENVTQAFCNVVQPVPGQNNVSRSNGRDFTTISSARQSIQPAPGPYNVSGKNGSDFTSVSSATQLIQSARLNMKRRHDGGNQTSATGVKAPCINIRESGISLPPVAGSTGSTDVKHNQRISLVKGTCDTIQNVSGKNGSDFTSVSSATQLIQLARLNKKRRRDGGNQISATGVKAPCINIRESGIHLPPVAGSTGSTDVKHNQRISLVKGTCDTTKNVPEVHMPSLSDGQKDVNLCDPGNSQGEKVAPSWSSKVNSKKKLSDIDKNNLMKEARNVILNKLNEWNAAARDNNECNAADNIENAARKSPEEDGLKTMEVPDSDFRDFDKDRTRKSFAENQVWAVYDEDDGMPRLYALIRKVSKRPFMLQISWLNSKSNMELKTIKWINSGFHKTCGDFGVRKEEISINLNAFSHRVTGWSKAARVYQIYPKKGDVWAVYKNWSPQWNKDTTDEEKHKYNVVEVLEDYNEDRGVTIVPLVKVAGFKAVFRHNLDAKEVRTVPKEEIFRFSHQVSSYLLTDQEAPKFLKGSKELDPAALPLELLQVIN